MSNIPDISLVLPCYNEEETIGSFFEKVVTILNQLELSYEIICVNDGSSDNTLDKLINIKRAVTQIKIIDFSKNFGKDAALLRDRHRQCVEIDSQAGETDHNR